ncbi:MAG: hypothetical protein IPM63_09190 [Acidobacteriota bacterium]|nr:MAG: hypothetical protein IPM63_09190 [Acidobacteriota bacterium]
MLVPGDEGATRLVNRILLVVTLVIAVPLLLVGIGLIIAGFVVDDSVATGEGFPLRLFLFVVGGGCIVAALATIVFKVALMYLLKFLTKGSVNGGQ